MRGIRLLNELLGNQHCKGTIQPAELPCCLLACSVSALARVFAWLGLDDAADASAEANGVDNCTFVAGDMLELFKPELIDEHGRPDVLIVDPPRAGMHPKVVGQIAHLRPERIVYVSCNPQTQARDLAMLQEAAAYTIEAVQPVDMFPHTHHVESVVGLRLA